MNKKSQHKVRLEWIDVLRAFAILLVVYGHRANTQFFSAFLNPVKMPLFFALSGYLFRFREGGDMAFFKKTFISLIIPWLFLGLVPLLLSIPIMGFSHAFDSSIDLFTGKLQWFMPCFILAQILFYYVAKLTKNHLSVMIACVIVISALGYFLKQKHILSIFMINLAMMVQFYFLIGFLYKRYESKLHNVLLRLGALLLLCYIIIGIIFYPYSAMDVHNARFLSLPIGTLMTTIGLIALFMLASCIQKYPRPLISVGKNSLVIYMLDRYALIPFSKIYQFHAPHPIVLTLFMGLIYLVYTSVVNIFIAKILNKYIPWATGNRG